MCLFNVIFSLCWRSVLSVRSTYPEGSLWLTLVYIPGYNVFYSIFYSLVYIVTYAPNCNNLLYGLVNRQKYNLVHILVCSLIYS